ncbi:hypothetical protein GW17_00048044 [Ensete ventricosum]|nr:hypothetical protein GW17_00048044 [Ensete ventricosum]
MGGTSEFGSGSRLMEWWSPSRAKVFQLGSGRCKSLYSGRCRSFVPDNPVALVAYLVVLAVGRTTAEDSALPVLGRPHDHWRPHTRVRPAFRVGTIMSTDQLSEGMMVKSLCAVSRCTGPQH